MKSRNHALRMSLTLCLLLAPMAGRGQPQGWHYNAGGRLLGVKSRGNNIWVVGAQGLILHSTDRGDTWNIRESGTTVDLYSVSFPDDLHGWAVGDYGYPIYVLRTTDGGVNWQIQTTINNAWGRGVSFVDTIHGWICGPIDTVLKTTDGGVTWTKKTMNQYNHGTGIVFLDTLRGFMSTDFGSVLKTLDGGQTWVIKNTSVPGLLSIDMLDSTRGWAAGAQIVKTADGWESSIIQYTVSGGLYGISVGDSFSIWSSGDIRNQAAIIRTTNGGTTWLEDSTLTRDATFYGVDGHLQLTNVTVVGDGGAIVRSTNSGNTWRVFCNVDIGNTSLLNVSFYDASRGWAVGTYGVITHTTNGGTLWTRQRSGGNFLYGVDFLSPQQGWVCGAWGTILGTTDGGTTWAPESSNTGMDLLSIDFPPNDTTFGVAVGGYYGPLDSLKGHGSTGAWEHGRQGETALQNAPIRYGISQGSTKWTTNEMLKQVQHDEVQGPRNDTPWIQDTIKPWGTGYDFWKWPWRPEETLLQTPYRTITRTTNGGAVWIAQNSTGQVPLYGVSFVTPREGWACGDPQGGMGVILHTTDSGATWVGQSSNVNQRLFWIQFYNNLYGWAVGSSGTALWTTDGGNTWNPGNTGITASLWSCAFYDIQNGFACGDNGLLIKTTDGGRNWQSDTSRVYANLDAVCALDSTHAWIVGSYGMVLGWREAGVSGVEQRGPDKDRDFASLNRIKAYPNPFVSFARVAGHEKDKFALYDVTGRRVGTYKGDRIGADATAGIYFLMAEGKEAGPVRIVKVR